MMWQSINHVPFFDVHFFRHETKSAVAS